MQELVEQVIKENPDRNSAANLLAEAALRLMRLLDEMDERLRAVEHRGERYTGL
jgi:hypothetical protein